eukprot:2871820-Ditylum_brightwellii.AAC.1
MERSKRKKHVVCNKDVDVDEGVDNGVDNGDDDSVEDGDEDGGDNGADGADKHFLHLSQATDCCLIKRSKQNEYVVYNKDNDVDDGVDNGDDDSVEYGDDD